MLSTKVKMVGGGKETRVKGKRSIRARILRKKQTTQTPITRGKYEMHERKKRLICNSVIDELLTRRGRIVDRGSKCNIGRESGVL